MHHCSKRTGGPPLLDAIMPDRITEGEMVTVSCCEGRTGYVYKGRLKTRGRSGFY
jgi:hypothetical protein